MKEALIILPALAILFAILFTFGKVADCPPGQIYVRGTGLNGACVTGHYR